MREFHFASPGYLLLLALLPVLFFALRRIHFDSRERLQRFLSAENLRQLLRTRKSLRERGKRFAFWAGLACLVLALARPQANPTVEETRSAGLDIYVLLDVSRSMDAEDVAPSRLKKAKRELLHLTSRLAGDRLGIIAFANSALLLTPLTSDYSILDSYLQNVDTSLVPSQGTNLGHALAVAKEAMERGAKQVGPDGPRSNIFLVMSDGEDHGESDLSVVDEIRKEGGLVFTVAIGTEKGVPIPIRDDRGELRDYKKDKKGQPVLTAVKTGVLQEVARRGGGQFYFATMEETEMDDILARVADAQRGSFTAIKTTVYEELYAYFLVPALLILLFSFVPIRDILWPALKAGLGRLRRVRPRLRRRAAAALLLAFLGAPRAEAGPISFFWNKERRASEASQKLAEEKKFGEAADALKELQADNPDQPEVNYNIGTYLLEDKKGQRGREQLSHLRNADGVLRDYALFNTAGSFAAEGKKEEARAAYADLLQHLESQPQLDATQTELVRRAKQNLARLADPNQPQPQDQKQQQQQQQGGGGGDSKDKKDQKDQKDQGQNGNDQKDQKNDKDSSQDKSGQDKKDESKKGDEKKDEKKDGQNGQNQKPEQNPEQNQNGRPQYGTQPFRERDNMGEDEAKRILGGLKERESSLQKKFLKNQIKGGKVNTDDAAQDW